ncbi:hypothetical protein EV130_102247 [Rhizobium azibense]|uniref:Uncharacterized protein n=2 Tax=Rhizobium azibense TaxID=1136135 RepID=A0A4R3R572_9HYPH|nr:hypothetical protein EV130_102247 [Rhizobium azibense]
MNFCDGRLSDHFAITAGAKIDALGEQATAFRMQVFGAATDRIGRRAHREDEIDEVQLSTSHCTNAHAKTPVRHALHTVRLPAFPRCPMESLSIGYACHKEASIIRRRPHRLVRCMGGRWQGHVTHHGKPAFGLSIVMFGRPAKEVNGTSAVTRSLSDGGKPIHMQWRCGRKESRRRDSGDTSRSQLVVAANFIAAIHKAISAFRNLLAVKAIVEKQFRRKQRRTRAERMI